MWSHNRLTERRRTRVGPVEIFYEVSGQGSPLILIHGLSGSSRWWARNVGPLARHFRVYVVDLVGFGGSRNRQPFVLQEAAGYIAEWMQQLGIPRATLIGHSMGGHIAAELACDFPERVERLILVDAAVLPLPLSYIRHLASMLREARQMQLAFMPVLLVDALRAGLLTLWQAANDLLTADLRPKLARIDAPTLVIWGERDAILPLDMGKQLSRYLRFDELVIIRGAGHNPMWDCPRAFNQIVVEFLEAATPPAGQHTIDCDTALSASRKAPGQISQARAR